jgi:hypothetical protein
MCVCPMQAGIISDLLDFEVLKGAAAVSRVAPLDVDAAVLSVVRMFTNSVRSKVTRQLNLSILKHNVNA